MTERYPRIRTVIDIEGEQITVLREGIFIAFYMPGFHGEVASAVEHSLERYLHALRPKALGAYVDEHGYWRTLDAELTILRQKLRDPRGAYITARGQPDSVTGVGFYYQGHATLPLLFARDPPQAMCAVEFWLPTEFLEQQGAEVARSLITSLGQDLPFSSGYAGLSFETWGWMDATTPVLRARSLRHPGFDLPVSHSLALYMSLGTKVRAPAWLTFLGPPVLNELGGAEGLRSRLHSPGTEVHSLSTDRAVVSLGPEPEAGDLEAGDTLPHYRELARVLEPWRYVHKGSWGSLAEEEIRHWERRFL
ncbi:type VI immunity family protein [Corallococcus terminator]|uniref:DUF3396 domain-containing protein n=1 Tax=Corallococcus terminator TaxID=2316733 RepID=A0A3A8JTS2_9BACT|nr:type VI immunity family protein [Corallococcus terminator]RKG93013.1 DUF3396 domain-containing protein [Corallococcus terminator]